MSGDVSFDVVSDFDEQELRNALDQARREILQRYDLKNAHIDIQHGKGELVLVTDDEYHAGVVKDLIESKAVRRNRVSSPRARSTRMAFGLIWMPAPTRSKRRACS